MAVTLSVILTYLIVQYMAYFKRRDQFEKQVMLPAENALFIRRSEMDVSQGFVGSNTKPLVKRVLPAGNSLFIRPSNGDLYHGTVDKKTKPISIEEAKKLSVWRFLKRRRSFKRNILRKSIVNLLLKSSLKNGGTVSVPSTTRDMN